MSIIIFFAFLYITVESRDLSFTYIEDLLFLLYTIGLYVRWLHGLSIGYSLSAFLTLIGFFF